MVDRVTQSARPDVADARDRLSPLASAFGATVSLATALGLADMTTLTLLTGGPEVALSRPDGPVGGAADDLQTRYDEGPSLAAARDGDLTVVEDATTERRWPQWTPAPVALGVGAVLSVPLPGRRPAGSLNLWSLAPRGYTTAEIDHARHLAAVTAFLLQAAAGHEHLRRAVDGRTLIGQAQGVLIERYRITPAAAFAALREHSQRRNRNVSDLADELVTTGRLAILRGTRPERPPPGGSADMNRDINWHNRCARRTQTWWGPRQPRRRPRPTTIGRSPYRAADLATPASRPSTTCR